MKKGLFVLVIVVATCFAWNASVFAEEAKVVDAGNKMCPLSGDEVKGKDIVEYNGKRYGLCCAMCKKDFLKNPEKYIKAMESGAQAQGMAAH